MLVFKLLPFRSYEKEGDPIKLLGPIRIKNIENRCYLSREDIEDDAGKMTKMILAEPRNSEAMEPNNNPYLSIMGNEVVELHPP